LGNEEIADAFFPLPVTIVEPQRGPQTEGEIIAIRSGELIESLVFFESA